VQEVEFPLTEARILEWLRGREVYRRTDYLALRRGDDVAVVAVRKASLEPLFSPVVDARMLAEPDAARYVRSPATDVSNATALAEAAEKSGPGARVYVVEGRFEHVNFIWEPAPVPVQVTEVVPPMPPKLFAQAEQAVAFDEDLPPVRLELDAVSVPELASANPAESYLLPCRGSGTELGAPVAFLDTRPAERRDWLMIGCERSLQFHRHFYGDEPPRLDLCPRNRVRDGGGLALVKCCLIERGIEVGGGTAVVPWGANLDEVREALRRLLLGGDA
jgi:hypothetical protein